MPRVGHKDLKRHHTKCLLHVLHRLLHWIHLGDINFNCISLCIIVYPASSRSWGSLVFQLVWTVTYGWNYYHPQALKDWMLIWSYSGWELLLDSQTCCCILRLIGGKEKHIIAILLDPVSVHVNIYIYRQVFQNISHTLDPWLIRLILLLTTIHIFFTTILNGWNDVSIVNFNLKYQGN